jgi:tyrosine decarboxylase/aspartate 1-decarboxylase
LDAELRVEIGSVERLVDDNTVALIGIAGTTEFGQIDPIPDLASLATSYNLFLHVDAAFGGFVIPFLDDKYDFDFRINGVSSISVDPHKMGMSTIPAGVLLFRERSYLEELSISTPYLSTKCQYSLIGTRSGASVAATYAVLKHLGYEGLRSNVKRCMKLTRMLVECAKGFDVFPVIEPVMNVVALDVPDVRGVIKALNEKGWSVSKTRDPEALRLVVMPHTKEENINAFVDDLWGVVK